MARHSSTLRVYAQWGNREKALEWLDKALRLRDQGFGHLKTERFRLWSGTVSRGDPAFVMIEIRRPRARASRDITVPIDTPVTSAISR